MSGGHDPCSVPMLFFVVFVASGGDDIFGTPASLSVEGGAQEICTRLASALGRIAPPGDVNDIDSAAVILGQWVQSVLDEGEGQAPLLVTTTDASSGRRRRWRCRRLICTAPPHTLGAIRFSPPLPRDVDSAARAMTGGDMIKFVAVFDRPFWREHGFSGRFSCLGGKQVKDAKYFFADSVRLMYYSQNPFLADPVRV